MNIVDFVLRIWSFLLTNWETIFSVLVALGIIEIIFKAFRQFKLKNPVKMFFLVPTKYSHSLDYVEQDSEEHLVDTLVLPSNSESLVMIWYRPKINYRENDRYFGCKVENEEDLKKVPRAIKVFNPFVIEGKEREVSPADNHSNHYRDWWESYHILSGRDRIKDEVYAGGFIVKTYGEGEYETFSNVATPTKLGTTKKFLSKTSYLKIIVKNPPYSKEIPCIKYKKDGYVKRFIKKDYRKHNLIFSKNDEKKK